MQKKKMIFFGTLIPCDEARLMIDQYLWSTNFFFFFFIVLNKF